MKSLTKRQQDIFLFIESYIQDRGFPPTVREIAAKFNLVSPGGVHKHIQALVKKKLLTKEDQQSRTLQVRRQAPTHEKGVVELPLMGYVAAGKPIEAIAQGTDTVAVPMQLAPNPRHNYLLMVKGDSMIEEAILDGDYVVMEPREQARNGEMVVALINGSQATLKRFYQEQTHIRLQPSNQTMAPILIKEGDLRIQGIVVGIWRRYR